jgi:hypothetical protein
VVTRFAAHPDISFWHDDNCGVRGAACTLTVPTMTVEHHEGIGFALVTNITASATAGQHFFH